MKKLTILFVLMIITVSTVFAGEGKKVYIENLQYDSVNSGLKVTDVVYAKVSEGKMFFAGDYTATLAAGASFYVLITSGTVGKTANMSLALAVGSDATLQVYEGATYTGGAAITSFNLDRNSANTADRTIIDETAEITDPGTQLGGTIFIPDYANVFPQSPPSGGALNTKAEMSLSTTANTLFVITNASAGADDFSYTVSWYEVE